MKNSQLLKGVLEGCVLSIIKRKEIYGYNLIKELQRAGLDTIQGGTVYPLLQKLEKNQLIQGNIKDSPDGPNRKYFTLTDQGKSYLADFGIQWIDLVEIVTHILKEEDVE